MVELIHEKKNKEYAALSADILHITIKQWSYLGLGKVTLEKWWAQRYHAPAMT